MPDITEYGKDDKIRLLLQGPSGSGKTDLACGFPAPWIIDIDRNLGGVLRRRRAAGLPLPVGYDVIDKDATGKEIPISQRFGVLDKALLAAQANPAVSTIIVDSATTLVDVMIAEVLRQQSKTEMTKREWGFFAILGKNLMAKFSAMGKHIVLIIHEKSQTTADGSVIYPIKVGWPGQVGDDMGKYFTNVWRCENKTVPGASFGTTTKYMLRTSPNGMYALKNTLGLPSEFEFEWSKIEAALKGGA